MVTMMTLLACVRRPSNDSPFRSQKPPNPLVEAEEDAIFMYLVGAEEDAILVNFI